jgi:hypothetical protein
MTSAAKSHPHVISNKNEWCHKIGKTPYAEAFLSQLKRSV